MCYYCPFTKEETEAWKFAHGYPESTLNLYLSTSVQLYFKHFPVNSSSVVSQAATDEWRK